MYGAIGGAIGGAFGYAGYALTNGSWIGAAAGAAAGGALSACITGGDAGMAAITGAITGGILGGAINFPGLTGNQFFDQLIATSGVVGLVGGTTAHIQGGNFWTGFGQGAAGAAAGFVTSMAIASQFGSGGDNSSTDESYDPAKNVDLTKPGAQEIYDQMQEIINEANRWNKTSPDWSWDYQCGEQAPALMEHLNGFLDKKYGIISPSNENRFFEAIFIGGAKRDTWIKILQGNHHVVKVYPSQAAAKLGFESFILDGFKGPFIHSHSTVYHTGHAPLLVPGSSVQVQVLDPVAWRQTYKYKGSTMSCPEIQF